MKLFANGDVSETFREAAVSHSLQCKDKAVTHTHKCVTLLSHLLSSLDSLENFSIEVFHIESFIYFFIHYLITVLIYICVRLSLRYFIVKLLNSVSFIFTCSSQAFSSSQLLDLSQLHHYFTICHNSYFFFPGKL